MSCRVRPMSQSGVRASMPTLRSAVVLVFGGLAAACGEGLELDPPSSEGGGYSRADGGSPRSCELSVSNVRVDPFPEAGLRITFSVELADGSPADLLQPEDVRLINEATGSPFQSEGGGVFELGPAEDFSLYTVLALDMSSSMFQGDGQPARRALEGALAFIESMANHPTGPRHQVAVYAFGSTSRSKRELSFRHVEDRSWAQALQGLLAEGSRGGTNLYGAHREAIRWVVEQSDGPDDRVLRNLVLLTDGTDEAGGDVERRREAALDQLEGLVDAGLLDGVHAIGIEGDYNPAAIRELADRDAHFYEGTIEQLESRFRQVADRLQKLASSNYVLGVCSPVEFGDDGMARLTVELTPGCATGAFGVDYRVDLPGWTGDVSRCDSAELLQP
ncbi:MAG TPA: vWA domain-containing protein [Myxococcales bacterium LLY-WYZ-16_1]|nr:vWA domain-containing protein [Myxococcales bacterium LLY-WYZ-16_1]